MNPETKEAKKEQPALEKRESSGMNGSERIQTRKVFVPLVDILESDQALLLLSDLPGVADSGVEVTVEKNILTIKGTIGEEVPAGFKLTHEEFGVGDYERSFTLPNEIDRDGIQATMRDGVLQLTLPKVKQAVAKRIPVGVG